MQAFKEKQNAEERKKIEEKVKWKETRKKWVKMKMKRNKEGGPE